MTTSTVEVDRDPEEVFAYATDPTRFSEWQDNVVDGHLEAGVTPAVGDKCLMTRRIGFANRVVTSEITEFDPPSRWGVRGLDGPVRARVIVSVTALGAGRRSSVSIHIDFEGHGIGKFIVPLAVRPRAAKEMAGNLQRLKMRLEDSAAQERPSQAT